MQFVEFISRLLDSKEQAIVWHNQTLSYAEHKALDKFQDELSELYDGLVESVSGTYGRPKNYSVGTLQNYQNSESVQAYFKELYAFIEKERKTIYQDSWIQNQVDEIAGLVSKTSYLLTLK